MRATIWGCRGSLATPGTSTVRYGGNTSCVEVRTAAGGLIVLDAGTGIRSLGLSLAEERPTYIDLLLTHMHLDHVEGLGFFAPIFDPDCTITIWGPPHESGALSDRIAAYLSPPLFPLAFSELPARIECIEVAEESWLLDDVKVTTAAVRHPGGALGYRLEEDGRSLAFVPDNEPALQRDSGLAVAAGADVLLHDAQYTSEEYRSRVGWGHTGLDDFAAYVAEARPARVVMFHHDPGHDDAFLERMQATAAELTGREVELACEGLVL